MVKALAATPRTISAIRKADALPMVRPGGKMGKGAYPGGFGGGTGTTIYIARTTARADAKTYTVDIYTGYTQTGTLVVADRIATEQTMITPNLNDTATVDQLPTSTDLAVVSRTFAAEVEGDPAIVRYYPLEHVGLI